MERPLTPEESQAYHFHVGAVLRAWAHLEFALMFYLQILLSTDQWRARAVWLSLPNFRARSGLIGRLVETFIDDSKTRSDFKVIQKRMKTMARNRNTLAHSIGGDLDTFGRHVFIVDLDDEKGPMEFAVRKTIQMKSIAQMHREMEALRSELGDFLRDRIAPNMRTSPRKRP